MLVEIEAGYARNEPVTLAVRKAIEAGVVELIKQGAILELWKFGPTQDELDKIEAELKAEEEAKKKAEEEADWNALDTGEDELDRIENELKDEEVLEESGTVSYTHLTLPTIYSV